MSETFFLVWRDGDKTQTVECVQFNIDYRTNELRAYTLAGGAVIFDAVELLGPSRIIDYGMTRFFVQRMPPPYTCVGPYQWRDVNKGHVRNELYVPGIKPKRFTEEDRAREAEARLLRTLRGLE